MQLNWKILLIEDDKDDYLITHELLAATKSVCTQLEWASSYEQGRQALEENQYDAILLDYDLGTKTGLDLIREFTKRKIKSPMILLTGRCIQDIAFEAIQGGASLFLAKGEVNTLLLEGSIRYAIERKKIEEQIRESKERF